LYPTLYEKPAVNWFNLAGSLERHEKHDEGIQKFVSLQENIVYETLFYFSHDSYHDSYHNH